MTTTFFYGFLTAILCFVLLRASRAMILEAVARIMLPVVAANIEDVRRDLDERGRKFYAKSGPSVGDERTARLFFASQDLQYGPKTRLLLRYAFHAGYLPHATPALRRYINACTFLSSEAARGEKESNAPDNESAGRSLLDGDGVDAKWCQRRPDGGGKDGDHIQRD